MTTRILFVDDDDDLRELLSEQLARSGLEGDGASCIAEARRLLEQNDYCLVLCDMMLGEESGLALCSWLGEHHPDVQVLVMTAFGTLDGAVAAMRAGAHDFISKPIDLELLNHTLRRALSHGELTAEVKRLRLSVPMREGSGIVGESGPVLELLDLVDRIADGDATVLVTGESGTGKELVARALHQRSSRRDGPFVALNCAALPTNLLESELFGHERGAFTDAKQANDGLLRKAHGGTLFLDEIGEMSSDVQVKLLRALQERVVRPLGGAREVPFDARIVCATNRDLELEVEQGRFREDFYYRINIVGLKTPPLRSRGNDVLLLAAHFLKAIAARTGKPAKELSPNAAERLLAYDWPGNVRQLQNVMERAMALSQGTQIGVDDLPERLLSHKSTDLVVADDKAALVSLALLERRYIERVLELARGNKAQAAKILGLDRRTLYRKMERWAGDAASDTAGDEAD